MSQVTTCTRTHNGQNIVKLTVRVMWGFRPHQRRKVLGSVNEFPITKSRPCFIQKLFGCKNENFHSRNFDIFNIFAQNIDCGYTLEPLQGSVLTSTQIYILEKKNRCAPVTPRITI